MDLIEDGLEDPINHWYYKHKFYFIKKAVKKRALEKATLTDIGAGSALFSRELVNLNLISKIFAVDTGYKVELTESNNRITYSTFIPKYQSDFYLLTDVREHIEEDGQFLSGVVRDAKVGAQFVITVPAHMSLWSGHDVYLKHFRRYNKIQLIKLASSSGLLNVKVRYIYSTVFPLALLQRRLRSKDVVKSQMRDQSRITSFLLSLVLLPDRIFGLFPFGVSLFLIAEKG
jgi:hypothetical protein